MKKPSCFVFIEELYGHVSWVKMGSPEICIKFESIKIDILASLLRDGFYMNSGLLDKGTSLRLLKSMQGKFICIVINISFPCLITTQNISHS